MTLIHDAGFLREHGIAPEQGGVLDQPPKFLDALPVIESEREATARAMRARESAGRTAPGGK